MKFIKFTITLFFLISSYWVSYLIFNRNFANAGISYSADDWNENTFMILLTSTCLSAIGILFLGILSVFTNFVFVRLIYAEEIKHAAVFYVKNRKKNNKALTEYKHAVDKNEWSKLTFKQKILRMINKIKNND